MFHNLFRHCSTLYGNNMFINPIWFSLKWPILAFSPLFEKHHVSHWFELQITKIYFKSSISNPSKYFYIYSYIQKTTLNRIKRNWISICNIKKPKTPKCIFKNPFFLSKIHEVGAPWASPDSFLANKLICPREELRPMRLY